MKNRFSKFGGLVFLALVTLASTLPTVSAAQPLGDSPGVYSLMASSNFNTSAVSTVFTNNGQYLGNAYLLLNVTNTAGTASTLSCTLWSSPDNSTWTVLSPVVSVTTNTPSQGGGAVSIALVGPIQNYAYLRTTNSLGGTTPAYSGSLTLIMPAKYR